MSPPSQNACLIWNGSLLGVFPLLCGIVFFSFIASVLAIVHITRLHVAVLEHSEPGDFIAAHDVWVVFYTATAPFLSLIHGLVDLCLFCNIRLHPIYALTGSLVMFCAWTIQFGFWTIDFDVAAWALQHPDCDGLGTGVGPGLIFGKAGMGIAVALGYIVYVILAAAAVDDYRKSKIEWEPLRLPSDIDITDVKVFPGYQI